MRSSEEVLFSTLAQIKAKKDRDAQRQSQQKQPKQQLEVVNKPTGQNVEKVDPQHELERIIIKLLLRYGNQKGEFEDFVLKDNEEGVLELSSEINEELVFNKIYMELQEDEIEFTNPIFKTIYELIIKQFVEQGKIDHNALLNNAQGDIQQEITSALLDSENHVLHRWDDKNIFVSGKDVLDPKEVTQTILNLRRLLIKKKIDDLSESIKTNTSDTHIEILSETLEYKKLEMRISDKIGRVM